MVKIMAMVDGQLKEINSKEMFELMNNVESSQREELKKVLNTAYGEMDMSQRDKNKRVVFVPTGKDENSGVAKATEKESNNEIENIINDVKNGGIESLLEILKEKAENCNCPKCRARRANEKSMNQDGESIDDILNNIKEALAEVVREIIESEEDERLHMQEACQRISDLEYDISNLVDDLKLRTEEFNDIEIKGIIYGITKKEANRYEELEKEILQLKIKLTELSKEKRDLIKIVE